MGNALRLFIFVLALTAVGLTTAISQIWLQHEVLVRQKKAQLAGSIYPSGDDFKFYHTIQKRAHVTVFIVSFFSLMAVAIAGNMNRRFNDSKDAVNFSRKDMEQTTYLAKTAVSRDEDLQRERLQRQVVDENLSIHQILLNKALSEKLGLGRDLHDGVIQSLYATGLTLESARQKRLSDQPSADELFDRGITMLNGSIREIRSYIDTLSHIRPELNSGFLYALTAITDTFKFSHKVDFILRIDEESAKRLHPTQIPDLLQIAREAISNALRHGKARKILVRLQGDDTKLALMVQDDGIGFEVANASGGYGLKNFQARADLLGAELSVTTQVNKGSRIVITIPVKTP